MASSPYIVEKYQITQKDLNELENGEFLSGKLLDYMIKKNKDAILGLNYTKAMPKFEKILIMPTNDGKLLKLPAQQTVPGYIPKQHNLIIIPVDNFLNEQSQSSIYTSVAAKHWALLVVDCSHKIFYTFDSLPYKLNYTSTEYYGVAYDRMKNMLGLQHHEWQIVKGICPEEKYAYDCAIHVSMNVAKNFEIFFNKRSLSTTTYDEASIIQRRRVMAVTIADAKRRCQSSAPSSSKRHSSLDTAPDQSKKRKYGDQMEIDEYDKQEFFDEEQCPADEQDYEDAALLSQMSDVSISPEIESQKWTSIQCRFMAGPKRQYLQQMQLLHSLNSLDENPIEMDLQFTRLPKALNLVAGGNNYTLINGGNESVYDNKNPLTFRCIGFTTACKNKLQIVTEDRNSLRQFKKELQSLKADITTPGTLRKRMAVNLIYDKADGFHTMCEQGRYLRAFLGAIDARNAWNLSQFEFLGNHPYVFDLAAAIKVEHVRNPVIVIGSHRFTHSRNDRYFDASCNCTITIADTNSYAVASNVLQMEENMKKLMQPCKLLPWNSGPGSKYDFLESGVVDLFPKELITSLVAYNYGDAIKTYENITNNYMDLKIDEITPETEQVPDYTDFKSFDQLRLKINADIKQIEDRITTNHKLPLSPAQTYDTITEEMWEKFDTPKIGNLAEGQFITNENIDNVRADLRKILSIAFYEANRVNRIPNFEHLYSAIQPTHGKLLVAVRENLNRLITAMVNVVDGNQTNIVESIYVRTMYSPYTFSMKNDNGVTVPYMMRNYRYIFNNTRDILWMILLLIYLYESYIISTHQFLRYLYYLLLALYFSGVSDKDWKMVKFLVQKIFNILPIDLGVHSIPFYRMTDIHVSGPLHICIGNDALIDCTNMGTFGAYINFADFAKTVIRTNANIQCKAILVIEHMASFNAINTYIKSKNDLSGIVTITGRGNQSLMMRSFMRKLFQELKVPIFLLYDCDAAGITCIDILRYGNKHFSGINEHITIPECINIPYSVFKPAINGSELTNENKATLHSRLSNLKHHTDIVGNNELRNMHENGFSFRLAQIKSSKNFSYVMEILTKAGEENIDLKALPNDTQFAAKLIALSKCNAENFSFGIDIRTSWYVPNESMNKFIFACNAKWKSNILPISLLHHMIVPIHTTEEDDLQIVQFEDGKYGLIEYLSGRKHMCNLHVATKLPGYEMVRVQALLEKRYDTELIDEILIGVDLGHESTAMWIVWKIIQILRLKAGNTETQNDQYTADKGISILNEYN